MDKLFPDINIKRKEVRFMAIIERIPCGSVNCFLIQEGNSAVLVDTCLIKHRDKILNACKGKNVKLIILTHGHMDHIQNAAYLSKELNAPIAMHRGDLELLKNNLQQPLSAHTLLGKVVCAISINSLKREKLEKFTPAVFLKNGDTLDKYGIHAVVLGLSGHTKGSIGILVDGTDLIVGDALMNMFYPTKSMLYVDREGMKSSAEKISQSKAERIHFGHGKQAVNKKW